jgi:predicted metalloprotease with PDZ domain
MNGIVRLGTSIGAFLLGAISFSQISYIVSEGSVPTKIKVSLTFQSKGESTMVQMPNWAPGSYRYANNWRRVSDVKVRIDGMEGKLDRSEEGKLPVIVTWSTPTRPGQTIEVSYEVDAQMANGIGHYSGPSTYMYPVGRTQEPCALNFAFSKPTRVAIGLNPVKENVSYKATTYDHLADNPVTFGDYPVDVYMQRGKAHYIAYRGAPAAIAGVDREYVKKACAFVSQMEGDFFGGVPYDRYVWHFSVNQGTDGAGGLEHLSSTEISMANGVGPGVVGVYAHEFFHLWNVKRIRSKPLGPFDYNTMPQTGALWWLEGVTDYFAHTLLGRYGWFGNNERFSNSIDKMYGTLVTNVNGVRAKPDRLNISPYDASFRVREAANGQGNSDGYLVSYYNTGWLCGLCLDIELLSETNGKRSLDDVERALFDECKDSKPGFEEGEIRSLCVKFGGAKLGEFYDRIITKPGELPVETQLAKLGYELKDIDEPYGKVPFIVNPSPDDKAMKVISSDIDGLKVGDIVTKINDADFNSDQVNALRRTYGGLTRNNKAGDKWTVSVKSGDQLKVVHVELVAATRKSKKVTSGPNVSPDQLKLRKIFESKKRK